MEKITKELLIARWVSECNATEMKHASFNKELSIYISEIYGLGPKIEIRYKSETDENVGIIQVLIGLRGGITSNPVFKFQISKEEFFELKEMYEKKVKELDKKKKEEEESMYKKVIENSLLPDQSKKATNIPDIKEYVYFSLSAEEAKIKTNTYINNYTTEVIGSSPMCKKFFDKVREFSKEGMYSMVFFYNIISERKLFSEKELEYIKGLGYEITGKEDKSYFVSWE
jgi:hypothetical protein